MKTFNRRTSLLAIATVCLGACPNVAQAEPSSPAGYWMTIDDETNQPKSVVHLEVRNGVLYGRIVKLLNPSKKDPKCEECSGDKQNKPVEGLEILWGLKPDGDEWNGGYILDPKSGKEYRCSVEVTDGGNALKVRGYIGISLLGRTQQWRRSSAPKVGG